MKTIRIELGEKSYSIFIKRNCIKDLGKYIKENHKGSRITLITDENLNAIYGDKLDSIFSAADLETSVISIKPGEASKSIDTLKKVYLKLSESAMTRGDIIVAFGGGVVGDLAGFAAATYLRGITYIQVPTSLLAQVDSSIGGKVAVDLPEGKNLVGSFYHPEAVFIDPELLRTLDKKIFNDGLAEVVKYGCIRDKSIIDWLMASRDEEGLRDSIEPVINKCCSIKKALVEEDEKDFGNRMLLNFGHTIGHAVEKYFNYEKYTHGEAVAMGMVYMAGAGEKLGLTEKGTRECLVNVLEKFDLPGKMPEMDKETVRKIILLDKKSRGDFINLVLIRDIGHGFIKKVRIAELWNDFKI
ncbi:MAG: 3-dehydroquinate synthase [Clostridiaceae bacterium]